MDSTDPEKLGPRAADVDGKKMLQLLNDCSGAFRPGILTALVGSSGAGKTTLMDVLAGRKTSKLLCSAVEACVNKPLLSHSRVLVRSFWLGGLFCAHGQ